MKKKDRAIFFERLEKDLSTMNSELAASYGNKKLSLLKEWAGNGFSCPKEPILFDTYSTLIRKAYLAKIAADFNTISETNNKLKTVDYKDIEDLYTRYFEHIFKNLETEISPNFDTISLWINNFQTNMKNDIIRSIDRQKDVREITKINFSEKVGAISIAISILSLILSIITLIFK